MELNQWALKWGVPYAALEDLKKQLGTFEDAPVVKEGQSESAVQSHIRLESSAKGLRLWRNNNGVAKVLEDDGSRRYIRYGLANESAQMNKRIKSSDLIGIRPVEIQNYHVGQTIGQFVAREVKRESWSYAGTAEELAQLKFLELVAAMGGDACFANKEGTL